MEKNYTPKTLSISNRGLGLGLSLFFIFTSSRRISSYAMVHILNHFTAHISIKCIYTVFWTATVMFSKWPFCKASFFLPKIHFKFFFGHCRWWWKDYWHWRHTTGATFHCPCRLLSWTFKVWSEMNFALIHHDDLLITYQIPYHGFRIWKITLLQKIRHVSTIVLTIF